MRCDVPLAAICLSLMIWNATLARAEVQIVAEQEVGAPGLQYFDVELNPLTFEVIFFQSRRSEEGNSAVYLGQLDPDTGFFVDHNYQYLDDATSMFLTFNGPEWGTSQQGDAVYYTKSVNGRPHTFRYRNGVVSQLDSGRFNLVANYPSSNPDDPQALVMGMFLSKDLLRKKFVWGVFPEDNPSALRTFEIDQIGKGPRFIPGRSAVTTNVRDVTGRVQVAIFDYALNQTLRISDDADDKDSAVGFLAPELNGELLIVARTKMGQGLRVYRRVRSSHPVADFIIPRNTPFRRQIIPDRTDWSAFRDVTLPRNKSLQNLQVLTYQNKTYFTYDVADSRGGDSGDIVLQSLDGSVDVVVSDPNVAMKRFDAETLISGDKLLIYYVDANSGRLFRSDVVITGDSAANVRTEASPSVRSLPSRGRGSERAGPASRTSVRPQRK
jgi:hypothetical protein